MYPCRCPYRRYSRYLCLSASRSSCINRIPFSLLIPRIVIIIDANIKAPFRNASNAAFVCELCLIHPLIICKRIKQQGNTRCRNLNLFHAHLVRHRHAQLHKCKVVFADHQKGLQAVPSEQCTNLPNTGWICPENEFWSHLNIAFFSFSLDYSLGDTSISLFPNIVAGPVPWG